MTNGWGDGPRTTPRLQMEKCMLWEAKGIWSVQMPEQEKRLGGT